MRYAFARFYETVFVSNLEKKLDSLWIGSYNLRVNIAKFQVQIKKISENLQKGNRISNLALVKENITFAEVIRSGKNNRLPKAETSKTSVSSIGEVGSCLSTVSIEGPNKNILLGEMKEIGYAVQLWARREAHMTGGLRSWKLKKWDTKMS